MNSETQRSRFICDEKEGRETDDEDNPFKSNEEKKGEEEKDKHLFMFQEKKSSAAEITYTHTFRHVLT